MQNEYESWYTDDILPAPAKPSHSTLRQKAAGLGARLPRPAEPQQRKALGNILRFFALVLVFTLVARGTSAATLAKVDTDNPKSGEIVKRVRGTGTVTASGTHAVEVPAGLTVEELMASPGQKVAAGDTLARLGTDEIGEELQRQQAALAELELKLAQLQRGSAHDGSALETAQRTLDRARQDYDATVSETNNAVNNAQNALNQAEDAANAAHEAMKAIEDKESQEYTDAQEDWAAKAAVVEPCRAALSQAQGDAQTQVQAAARALEDAQAAHDSAARADADTRQEESDTAAQNNIEATTVGLDIEEKRALVETLQALQKSGGTLLADADGTVQALPEVGTKTDETTLFELATAAGGYQAELWLDKKDAEKLAPGDSCEIALTDSGLYYRNVLEGTVTTVDAPGEDGRARVTVRLPEDEWKVGQTVDVQVVQQRQSHTMCVPLSALHSANDGYFVLVPQEESTVLGTQLTAVKAPVTVTAQDDTLAAVEGALSTRDRVITGGSKAVQPGDKVRVNAA